MGEKDIRGGCLFFVQTDLNIYLSFFKDSLFGYETAIIKVQ